MIRRSTVKRKANPAGSTRLDCVYAEKPSLYHPIDRTAPMNPRRIINNPSGLGGRLVLALGCGTVAFAASPPQSTSSPAKSVSIDPIPRAAGVVPTSSTAQPAGQPAMNCSSCKTAPLAEPFFGQWKDSESDFGSFKWFVVGSKHTCQHCDGAIAVKYGRTTWNSMRQNCQMCGESAGGCVAAMPRES